MCVVTGHGNEPRLSTLLGLKCVCVYVCVHVPCMTEMCSILKSTVSFRPSNLSWFHLYSIRDQVHFWRLQSETHLAPWSRDLHLDLDPTIHHSLLDRTAVYRHQDLMDLRDPAPTTTHLALSHRTYLILFTELHRHLVVIQACLYVGQWEASLGLDLLMDMCTPRDHHLCVLLCHTPTDPCLHHRVRLVVFLILNLVLLFTAVPLLSR